MNKDTPRTNRFYASFADGECIPNQDEWLALCESLETELTAVTEQRDRLAAYRDEFEEVAEIAIDILAGNHPVIDWRDAGQSELLRELCQYLEENAPLSALDDAREENIGWKNKWQVAVEMAALAENKLTAVTEQRDRAWQKIENQAERITYLEGATNHATGTPLSKAIEQRDRLAEAVDAATILIAAKGRHNTMLAYNGLRDALQSLTTNEL